MKILILTGKFGMGHWSASQALEEQLRADGHETQIVDLFGYALPEQAPAMYRGFSLLVTYCGAIYNLYHQLTANTIGDGPAPVERLLEALTGLLDEVGPDVVISTHPACSAAMSHYKLDGMGDIPLVTCVTDVTSHSEWIQPGTDYYMVAEESVRRALAEKGVEPWRIVASGLRG